MRTRTLFSAALFTLNAAAQTLFTEDFEGTPSFTLNTTDANSVPGVANTWVVNNVFTGGTGTVDCSGFLLDFSIPGTAPQPVDISGSNGSYLHTASIVALNNNILNCSFGAADGFCTDPDDVFARMSTDVSTLGSSDVSLKFWWLCNGGNQNYGELYYSTNGGTSWIQVTVPIAQYRNTTNWGEQTVTLPAFGNQATLRFGFRFHNGTSFLGGSDPGFAIDDVRIIATTTDPVGLTTSVTPLTYCQGAALNAAYTISGTFNPGNTFTVELSDATGNFGSPVQIGSLVSTTGGSVACIIPPGTIPGVGYRIRVVSSSPVHVGADNGSDIIIYDAPFAGSDGSLSFCSGADAGALSTGGDPGGTWSGPSTVVNDLYDPATMDPGTYTYTVTGSGPCASDAATVEVSEIPGANAGNSVTTVICKNTGVYDLFTYLGGTPDAGGTWTAPGGAPSDGTFNSATATGGIYTYAVNSGGSCGADEAVVSVTLGLPGEAGPDATWSVCSDDLPVDLFDLLDLTADLEGVWFNSGIPFDGEAVGGGDYVYIDYALQPCANDTANITLEVEQAVSAGANGTVEVCTDAPPLDLFSALTGGAAPGGTWTGPGGAPHSGTFIPGADPFGLYTYTVFAPEPCGPDEALLALVPCVVGLPEQEGSGAFVWLGQDGGGLHLFSVPDMKGSHIKVFDTAGSEVRGYTITTSAGQLKLDMRTMASGVYTLHFRARDGMASIRFVH